MQPWDAAQALNAFKITSVILYDVSTLPPTIGICSSGFKILFSGIITDIGFKHPLFKGISLEMRHLRQYNIADIVTDFGQFVFDKT